MKNIFLKKIINNDKFGFIISDNYKCFQFLFKEI